ncbi:MAG: riboflavin synthase [Actinomycetota bacterium]|nr:riboflavin synthase [Actinomycetota bacterium]
MFTGLIQGSGRIVASDLGADGVRLRISSALARELSDGDSIAVDGVCVTATGADRASFGAEVMNETLARTSLHRARAGTDVNLELPLRAVDRLGGHVVQGHVDAVGTVVAVTRDGFASRMAVEIPDGLGRYIVEKGSIAVQGVSLTVVELDCRSFTVSLIPETLQRTNLGGAQPGTAVNLEVDVLAKYVEKLIGATR